MCNVSRLGLQQEEEVSVFLCLIVVRKSALLHFLRIVDQAVGELILLSHVSATIGGTISLHTYLLQLQSVVDQ